MIVMDHSLFSPRGLQALGVPCIKGTVFESRPVELNGFLQAFQALRISSKPRVEVRTELDKDRIKLLDDIHRSFDMVFEGQTFPPPSIGSRILYVTTFNIWPNHFYNPTGLAGTDVTLFNLLATKFQFSYRLLPPALSVNGRILENGTLVGILPDVRSGVADLAMCQLTLTNERYQVLDFAPVLSEHDIVLVGPKAKPKSAYEALTLPFDHWTWLGLCISLLGCFIMLALFKVNLSPDKGILDNTYEAFCLAIAPLLQESISHTIYRSNGFMSIYCFLFLWTGMGLLMTLAYKSTLLATMTMVVFNGVIDTPEEVRSSQLPVYVLSQSLMETALISSPRKIYQDIYDQNVTPFGTAFPLSSTPPDMNDKIDDNRAFLISTRTNTIRNANHFAFKDSIYVGSTSWLGPKGSRFLAQISDPLMRLQAGGMTNKWFQDELQSVLNIQGSMRNQPIHEPINLGHMAPPLILLICNLVICFAVFLGEVIGSHVSKNKVK
ncbi:hypothetical protein TCAL_14460 [Tigriopus californicus]|uniref:Ionotropic glutamate receptor C-terminal domain-containing protein n=1 Tax=Tigriopus californicus TaxID=6832 RepID=A0A553PSH8_TIGCA|nr:hypothetical protein TCAL_14460 [Tigriopus californicus]